MTTGGGWYADGGIGRSAACAATQVATKAVATAIERSTVFMAQHPWNPKDLTAYHSSWGGAEASLVNAGELEKILGGVAQKTLIAAATIKKIRSFILTLGLTLTVGLSFPMVLSRCGDATACTHRVKIEERFDRFAALWAQ
jgi:hypothetical protein